MKQDELYFEIERLKQELKVVKADRDRLALNIEVAHEAFLKVKSENEHLKEIFKGMGKYEPK